VPSSEGLRRGREPQVAKAAPSPALPVDGGSSAGQWRIARSECRLEKNRHDGALLLLTNWRVRGGEVEMLLRIAGLRAWEAPGCVFSTARCFVEDDGKSGGPDAEGGLVECSC